MTLTLNTKYDTGGKKRQVNHKIRKLLSANVSSHVHSDIHNL